MKMAIHPKHMSPIILIMSSVILLLLSFESWTQGVLGYFALAPLIMFWNRSENIREVFIWSWLCGFIFFLVSLYWLAYVTLLGLILLSAFQALYVSSAGALYQFVKKKNPILVCLFVASLWTSLEYIRGIGQYGFPFLYMGISQIQNANMIQVSSLGGIYCLSFVLMWVNTGLAQLFSKGFQKRFVIISLLIGVSLIGTIWCYGQSRRNQYKRGFQSNKSEYLRVAVIQPNIAQSDKWDVSLGEDHLRTLINLSQKAAIEKPQIIIWPESCLQGNLKTDQELFKRISQLAVRSGSYLMIGANDEQMRTGLTIYNSAFLINPDGLIVDQYNKIHLVPYGEYAPLRNIFPKIAQWTLGEYEFSRGSQIRVFLVNNLALSPMICFEDIFPSLMRRCVMKGAGVIVNITNDAWYEKSKALRMHVEHAAMCAVANGIGLIQSANTGVSCVVSPTGEITKKIIGPDGEDIAIDGYGVWDVPLKTISTLYTRIGDVFPICCTLLCLVLWLLSLIARKDRS
ncbi:MAG: apolipoprotein N-acyltransferase [Chlamydiota bacterium]|nr:apolipoprotein N-acyltransferase [Chlamydiota bacterium]